MTATKNTSSVLIDSVILVNEHDKAIGTAEKLFAHQHNLLHRAFSVFIFRKHSDLELLLQQRAFTKYHSPGLWTNTCCSHPRPGESTIAAGERRLQEEFGISASLQSVGVFCYNAQFTNGLTEHEIDHVLNGMIPFDASLTPNPEEVADYRWVKPQQLKNELAASPATFTPWFAEALAIAIGKY